VRGVAGALPVVGVDDCDCVCVMVLLGVVGVAERVEGELEVEGGAEDDDFTVTGVTPNVAKYVVNSSKKRFSSDWRYLSCFSRG